MTKFSAQLLTHHRTDTLRPLFASLQAQTLKGWTLQWLDSGSTPEEYAAMQRILDEAAPTLSVVRQRSEVNINFSAGHQSLYAASDAEYVALVNDDAILDPTYFEEIVAAMDARPDLGSASGVLLRWNFSPSGEVVTTDIVDSLGLSRSPWQAVTDTGAGKPFDRARLPATKIAEAFGVSGCLPVYRRSAVGPQLFNPAYVFYKEDVDAAYRLHRAGFTAGVVGSALAHHQRSLKPSLFHRGASYRRLFYSYRNHLWNLKTNLSARDWLLYGWCILPYELAKALFLLCTHPTILWRVLRNDPA